MLSEALEALVTADAPLEEAPLKRFTGSLELYQ